MRFAGAVERSADRIVTGGWESGFVGLHPGCGGGEQKVRVFVLEPAAILRRGMEHDSCDDAGKGDQHRRQKQNSEPRTSFHDQSGNPELK